MSEIISAAVLLILIMDPLGNLPIFMSVLKHTEPKRRRAIMIRELLIALLVMFIFLFAGEKILAFLNLRAETVSISGGIILFLIAIKMIFPSAEGSSSGLPAGEEPFIDPARRGANHSGDADAAVAPVSESDEPSGDCPADCLGRDVYHPAAVVPVPATAGRKRGKRAGTPHGADSGHDGNADVPGRDPGVDEGMTFSLSPWERASGRKGRILAGWRLRLTRPTTALVP